MAEGLKQFDLTPRIAPFLDYKLLEKLIEYEGTVKILPESELAGYLSNAKPSDSVSETTNQSAEHAFNLYKKGEFKECSELLGQLKSQIPGAGNSVSPSPAPEDGDDVETSPEVERLCWGKLAADILAGNAAESLEGLVALQDIIDQKKNQDALVQLTSRTWLAHWALFVYFTTPQQSLDKLIETWTSSQWMSTIQSSSPWLLRYLTVAVLIGHPNSARHTSRRIKDLVRVVQQELYEYTDPVLDFIKSLFVDVDFAVVGEKLREATAVLSKDFFTRELAGEFETSAKFLIADLCLRVHDRIAIDNLAKMVGSTPEWLTTTYAEIKPDVQINEETKTIRFGTSRPEVLQIVTEKTKNVDQRMHQILTQARLKRDS